MTQAVSKQLLPIYDKPMIYYPLSTLMLAGIRDILIISTPQDLPRFQRLLGDGTQLGAATSPTPSSRGPRAWRRPSSSARDFVGRRPVALVLGDNIFYGHGLAEHRCSARPRAPSGATVFGYHVQRSGALRRGRVRRDGQGGLASRRSPTSPESNYAVTGLYFYDNQRARHRGRA